MSISTINLLKNLVNYGSYIFSRHCQCYLIPLPSLNWSFVLLLLFGITVLLICKFETLYMRVDKHGSRQLCMCLFIVYKIWLLGAFKCRHCWKNFTKVLQKLEHRYSWKFSSRQKACTSWTDVVLKCLLFCRLALQWLHWLSTSEQRTGGMVVLWIGLGTRWIPIQNSYQVFLNYLESCLRYMQISSIRDEF